MRNLLSGECYSLLLRQLYVIKYYKNLKNIPLKMPYILVTNRSHYLLPWDICWERSTIIWSYNECIFVYLYCNLVQKGIEAPLMRESQEKHKDKEIFYHSRPAFKAYRIRCGEMLQRNINKDRKCSSYLSIIGITYFLSWKIKSLFESFPFLMPPIHQ